VVKCILLGLAVLAFIGLITPLNKMTTMPGKTNGQANSKTGRLTKLRRIRPLFDPDGIYTHEQVMRVLGIGPEAWRLACKRGLCHGQIARRLLVTGRQLAQFIEALGEQRRQKLERQRLEGGDSGLR
jgi:hypothetical protein